MFTINPSSNVPIYLQIVDQVKEGIIKGHLAYGDKLPSVRELAVQITINPNTIQKAYQELERQKILETIRGRGTFVVSGYQGRLEQEKIVQLEEYIKKGVIDAYYLGLSPDSFREMVWKLVLENMIIRRER